MTYKLYPVPSMPQSHTHGVAHVRELVLLSEQPDGDQAPDAPEAVHAGGAHSVIHLWVDF